MESTSPLLTSLEASLYIRRPENWLRKQRMGKGGPPFVKMHGRVFYQRNTLDTWLAGLERTSTEPRRQRAA